MRRFEARLARVALESARRHAGLLPVVAVAVVLQPPVPTIRPMNSLMLTLTHHEERGDYDDVVQVGGVDPASYYLLFSAKDARNRPQRQAVDSSYELLRATG